MPYKTIIEAQGRPPVRPASALDLLLHKIAPDPDATSVPNDAEWAKEHAGKPQFYIGGQRWFRQLTGLSSEQLATYKEEAARIAQKIGWPSLPGADLYVSRQLQRHWQSISRQQFYSITKTEPALFPKAALYLLACELALANRIDKFNPDDELPKIPDGITPGEIYRNMAIVPACWNVDNFNAEYLERRKAASPGFMQALSNHTTQSNDFLNQLATGYTATYRSAKAVKNYCDTNGEPLGAIRSRAGRSILGSRGAAQEDLS